MLIHAAENTVINHFFGFPSRLCKNILPDPLQCFYYLLDSFVQSLLRVLIGDISTTGGERRDE